MNKTAELEALPVALPEGVDYDEYIIGTYGLVPGRRSCSQPGSSPRDRTVNGHLGARAG